MKSLLEGKRVFEQETIKGTRYLLVPENKIEKYKYLACYLLIKKGDFEYPRRWIRYTDIPFEEAIVPLDTFNIDDYEYIILPDFSLEEGLKEVFEENGIDTDPFYKGLMKFEKIPVNLQALIRDALERSEGADDWFEEHKLECFTYQKDGKQIAIALTGDPEIHDVKYEYTQKFLDKRVVKRYFIDSEKTKELISLRDKEDIEFHPREEWFVLYSETDNNSFFILENVYDVEDIIPFVNFVLTYEEDKSLLDEEREKRRKQREEEAKRKEKEPERGMSYRPSHRMF
ncbi:hypothetical protein IUK39_29415 [Priestia aryabhattai]|uniref:hypothetical protein n=1 Tax=Priestia aryabhattai TaxID=412384 RepID=UPI001C0E86E5|nr:hypothetical protein [Priestia aryabhattai]MBU3574162.1 hypothetical protein [Priestia aryabhattai]